MLSGGENLRQESEAESARSAFFLNPFRRLTGGKSAGALLSTCEWAKIHMSGRTYTPNVTLTDKVSIRIFHRWLASYQFQDVVRVSSFLQRDLRLQSITSVTRYFSSVPVDLFELYGESPQAYVQNPVRTFANSPHPLTLLFASTALLILHHCTDHVSQGINESGQIIVCEWTSVTQILLYLSIITNHNNYLLCSSSTRYLQIGWYFWWIQNWNDSRNSVR